MAIVGLVRPDGAHGPPRGRRGREAARLQPEPDADRPGACTLRRRGAATCRSSPTRRPGRTAPCGASSGISGWATSRSSTDPKRARRTARLRRRRNTPSPGSSARATRTPDPAMFPAPVSYRADAGPADRRRWAARSRSASRSSIADVEAGPRGSLHRRLRRTARRQRLGNRPASMTTGSSPARSGRRLARRDSLRTCGGTPGRPGRSRDGASTLYNHALAPNASPSCIAVDEKTGPHGRIERPRRGG